MDGPGIRISDLREGKLRSAPQIVAPSEVTSGDGQVPVAPAPTVAPQSSRSLRAALEAEIDLLMKEIANLRLALEEKEERLRSFVLYREALADKPDLVFEGGRITIHANRAAQ